MAGALTLEDVEDLAAGRKQIRFQSWSMPTKLCARERRALEQAKKRGYLLCRQDMSSLRNIWWYWCNATGQPHVIVQVRRRYGSVSLELVGPGQRLSVAGIDALRTALRSVGRGGFGWSDKGGSHPTVPLKKAEPLARELLRLARKLQQ